MAFRINLEEKDGVSIILVVVRDQIVFNFQSNRSEYVDLQSPPTGLPQRDMTPYRVRDRFSRLLDHFKLETEQNIVRGEDAEHVKRHHGYSGELRIAHRHIGFNQNVTPLILQQILDGILDAQKYYGHSQPFYEYPQDNFFLSEKTASDVVKAFESYYKVFANSSMEKQELEERRLTKQEKASLEKAAQAEVFHGGILSQRDKEELTLCKIVPALPKPPQPNASSFFAPSGAAAPAAAASATAAPAAAAPAAAAAATAAPAAAAATVVPKAY